MNVFGAQKNEITRRECWNTVERHELFETTRGLRLWSEVVELPDGSVVPDFYQIKMPDFTVVYASNSAGSVICIQQYKHGMKRVALTLPGGLIDQGESPLKAAQRELLEETGYICSTWKPIGEYILNGNQGIATAHIFVATGGSKAACPKSGDLEDMSTVHLSPKRLALELREGNLPIISHAAAVGLAQAIHTT